LIRRHERVFVSRYGGRIFEDILVLAPRSPAPSCDMEFARRVGTSLLEDGLGSAPMAVRPDIERAIQGAAGVLPSPIVTASTTA
jgi:hypothetical protein